TQEVSLEPGPAPAPRRAPPFLAAAGLGEPGRRPPHPAPKPPEGTSSSTGQPPRARASGLALDEVDPVDWTAVGPALVSVIIGVGGGIAWWQQRAARAARSEAEAAKAGADRAVADAEHTLYKLLAERQAQLEQE